jgi:IS1 family transposase
MKTAIQELIERIKQFKYSEINEQAWDAYDSVMDLAESLLEKEKEQIMDAYDSGWSDGVHSIDLNDEYYFETFNING